MRVVVGGIKGGIGKTSIAINLAIMRQRAGRRVVLVDADEQRSAKEFAEQRSALGNPELPTAVASSGDTLQVVRQLAEEFDDAIVDVGGRDTRAQRAAMLAADLAIIPFTPGNFDVWTLPQIETLISEVRQGNPELDAIAFISRGYHQGKDNAEAADMLRASSVLRFVDAPVLERRVYVRSAGDGLSVIEFKPYDDKAINELIRLYRSIFPDAASAAA